MNLRFGFALRRILYVVTVIVALFAVPAATAGPDGKRYASIAVDADSREILHARQIDAPRYPASLTKMMTLYLVFDAIERGDLSLSDTLVASRRATRVEPVKLGLRHGETITVHQAIQALAVKSSNDVSVVLAERLGGSEDQFAIMMTQKARAMGMNSTTYKTASGLPHPEQLTTARDQAKLADQLLVNHRKYYHYFGQQTFMWRGRMLRTHNALLGKVDGVDGFKTGYTNDSGYNLTISAQRDGRRIIAVVLGGASNTARNQHMERLVDRAFDVQAKKPQLMVSAQPQLTQATYTGPAKVFTIRGRGATTRRVVLGQNKLPEIALGNTWQIQIGVFGTPDAAQNAVNMAGDVINKIGQPQIKPHGVNHRARITALSGSQAQAACQALKAATLDCLLVAPAQ